MASRSETTCQEKGIIWRAIDAYAEGRQELSLVHNRVCQLQNCYVMCHVPGRLIDLAKEDVFTFQSVTRGEPGVKARRYTIRNRFDSYPQVSST